jgi:dihydrofolate synthase/folylpolyglutamate synthase
VTIRLQRRLEALYGLERRKDKLGLDGTRVLLDALGNPHTRFRSVHVAGTNGKGSVCALVERALRQAGIRTGLYTSPHLVDFRERIRVVGQWADEDWLEEALDRIEALPEANDRTFFEVATALGFLYFAERGVDIAVVEVGLGGRLDCTNVLTPLVSVITSIGLDHTEILGDTIEKIAAEKAGIIKPGVPVVLSRAQGKAHEVLASVARERGSPIVAAVTAQRVDTEVERLAAMPGERHITLWVDPNAKPVRPGLGRDNVDAARSALHALVQRGVKIPAAAIAEGFAAVRWPGRMEACPSLPRLWWDGAHNGQGLRRLGATWPRLHPEPPGQVVLALSRDKDLPSVITELRWAFKPLHLIATRSRSERAADPAAIAAEAAHQGVRVETAPDVESAIRTALDSSDSDVVLLTGSLFAVGEAMEIFGGAPGEWL